MPKTKLNSTITASQMDVHNKLNKDMNISKICKHTMNKNYNIVHSTKNKFQHMSARYGQV